MKTSVSLGQIAKFLVSSLLATTLPIAVARADEPNRAGLRIDERIQSRPTDVENEADITISEHQIATKNLINSRGVFPLDYDHRPARLHVRDLQSALAAGPFPLTTAILFYALHQDQLRAFLVTPTEIIAAPASRLRPEELATTIDLLASALDLKRLQLARSIRPRGLEATMPTEAAAASAPVQAKAVIRKLSDWLLPDAMRQRLATVHNLIVVPSGPIGTVPYALLVPFADDKPAIEHMAVSIAPDIEILAHQEGKPAWNAASGFAQPLVVGNPAFAYSDKWIVPPLPGAEREAASVASIMSTKSLLGDLGRLTTVRLEAKNATLLYFATHGLADGSNPLDGGALLFAGPTLEQGMWTAREIQSEPLSASMAVLSACQSGLGSVMDGGVVGLARAFLLAGVPRVTMSLWNVDDDATAWLMTRYVVALRNNPPPEAMRQAMLETRVKYPKPALWASFAIFSAGR